MHVIVWEFGVRPERVAEFLEAYGPEGEWARLFQQSPGFLGTELMIGDHGPNCFMTVDRWRTAEDFERFKQQHAAAYAALDARLAHLTVSEEKIGAFEA